MHFFVGILLLDEQNMGPCIICYVMASGLDSCSTVWKCKNFSATQILRQINFRERRRSKTATLTFLQALNFDFDDFFFIF